LSYTNTVVVPSGFEKTVALTRQSLGEQGFGVLTEIDVRDTFATKLGAESADVVGDYIILGACNPRLAERAVAADPNIGAFLPCNVIVRRGPDADATTVQAIDPQAMVQLSDAPEMTAIASEVGELLARALATVKNHSTAEAHG